MRITIELADIERWAKLLVELRGDTEWTLHERTQVSEVHRVLRELVKAELPVRE